LFGLFNKQKGKPGLLGVSFVDGELALAHMAPGYSGLELRLCQMLEATSLQAAGATLGTVVRREGLEQTRCNFMLARDDYNLLLIEAPPVEADELASAAKWKIKDMIDRPLEQVAVAVFPVPATAYRGQRQMLYVVAADRKRVQQRVDLVTDAGLQLEAIDIPELALLNLSRHCLDDSEGLAMLDLRQGGGLINLSRDGDVYLTRHLNTRISKEMMGTPQWDSVRERLVLEIRRTLDYYESQMGQTRISRLVLSPGGNPTETLVTQLNEAMGVSVEMMNLEREFSAEGSLPGSLQYSCALAIGASLRPLGVAA